MAVLAHHCAASVENSLAIEVSVVFGACWSFSQPARQVSIRDASSRSFISASISWTSWKAAIGRPNCSRSVA